MAIKKYAELYKRTAKQDIQVWYIEAEGASYRMCSGKLGGKIVTSTWTGVRGKNVGRTNATTDQVQAVLEVEAAYRKKIKEGYSETLDAAKESTRFTPMLAQHYSDRIADVEGDLVSNKAVFSQPKLNGMRCNARLSGLMSRKNTPIVAVPHIEAQVRSALERRPSYAGLILDGELYNHDFADDLQTLLSAVRKSKPSAEDLEASKAVQYWIYDIAGTYDGNNVETMNLWLRQSLIKNVLTHAGAALCQVPTTQVRYTVDLDALYDEYLGAGYEGQMVRRNGPYERNKRSALLLKRKEEEDHEYELVDVHEGTGNRAGMAGYATVRLPDGRTCDSGIKGGEAFYRDFLANKDRYIGGQVTVTHNGLTPDGMLNFPRIKVAFEGERDV